MPPVVTGTLQIKRVASESSLASLTLLPGQQCFALDTQRTWIGTPTGNVLFAVPLRVQVAGILLPAQNTINFSGSGVSVANDAASSRTNVTITGNTGTVTSVAASGGTTGLTFGGSPITSSGTFTLGGTLAIGSGGTGATSAAAALSNLGGVPLTRTVSTTGGLAGGGALASNLSLSISDGGVTAAKLSPGGTTPDATKYYRGDGTWQTVSSSGGMTNPMTTFGDIIYGAANGTPTRLARGANLTFFGFNSAGAPFYQEMHQPVDTEWISTNTTYTSTFAANGTRRNLNVMAYNAITITLTGDDLSPASGNTGYFRRLTIYNSGYPSRFALQQPSTGAVTITGLYAYSRRYADQKPNDIGHKILSAITLPPFCSCEVGYSGNEWTVISITDPSAYGDVSGTGSGSSGGFTGTAGSIPFVSSGGTLTESNATLFRQAATGNIGIGTSSPSAILHVVGGGAGQGNAPIFQSVNSAGVTFYNTGGSTGNKMTGISANTADNSINFRVYNDAGTAIVGTPLSLMSNGNAIFQGSVKGGGGFVASDGTAGTTTTDSVYKNGLYVGATSGNSFRSGSRSVVPGDTSTLRTLTTTDRFISLEGTATGGVFTFHSASNVLRIDPISIRNNSTQSWTIQITSGSGDLFYQDATGLSSFTLLPGESLRWFNRAANRWETPD